jgi:hypothetical protein
VPTIIIPSKIYLKSACNSCTVTSSGIRRGSSTQQSIGHTTARKRASSMYLFSRHGVRSAHCIRVHHARQPRAAQGGGTFQLPVAPDPVRFGELTSAPTNPRELTNPPLPQGLSEKLAHVVDAPRNSPRAAQSGSASPRTPNTASTTSSSSRAPAAPWKPSSTTLYREHSASIHRSVFVGG